MANLTQYIEQAIETGSLAAFVTEYVEGGNLSVRGTAALCGVNDTALGRGGSLHSAKLAQKLLDHGFQSSGLIKYGFPAMAVWLTLEYFAYESKAEAKYAKAIASTFGLLGIKAAFNGIEPATVPAPKPTPATPAKGHLTAWLNDLSEVSGLPQSSAAFKDFAESCLSAQLGRNKAAARPAAIPTLDTSSGIDSHVLHWFKCVQTTVEQAESTAALLNLFNAWAGEVGKRRLTKSVFKRQALAFGCTEARPSSKGRQRCLVIPAALPFAKL